MNAVPRIAAAERRSAAELVDYTAEQALLAAVLLENRVMAKVAGWLRPEHFGDALHGRIYEACQRLVDRGDRADMVTLWRLFDRDSALVDIGGAKYIADLASAAVTIQDADDYGRIVLDLARKRALLRLADEMRETVFDPARDFGAIAADLAGELHRLNDVRRTGGGNARELAMKVVEQAQRPSNAIPTGLPSLDAVMAGGLWPGRAYALRGQTKAGKSALSGTIAANLNASGHPCLYLAWEMTPLQIARRDLARRLGVNGLALLPGARADMLVKAEQAASATPAVGYYEAMAGRTLEDAGRLIHEHVVAHGITGVIVDYVQLVRGAQKGEGRAEFTERVAYDLIALCGRLDLWILFLSQLNRDGQTRWGDGLNFAVDQMFTLYRGEGEADSALVMDLTRDTAYRSVGAIDDAGKVTRAGLYFHKDGPYFTDAADEPPQEEML